ncbi:Prefoldin subunit 2 [Seminavis robusta]|uniref:Prefoldin subunit 2 n=1 Tax=Seminavis robusta TaxID=568900 RepID=A0A9N8HAZ4_9STRA|nr:Prefoldin subunit 2 [Seminavis robusta]|eukprot:Sro243_g096910.1 Prefoldin subunit 2 (119) ;mRNA; f:45474-45976
MATTTATPAQQPLLSQAAVVQKYRQLTQECQQLMSKVAELEQERNEHKLVEETLTPLDPDRRAYRLVGEVLVERTVKEVLPSVKENRENLEKTITTLRERLTERQRQTAEFKAEYKLQ